MSDAAQPGPDVVRTEVRTAAESLKRAIDDHLAAVAARSGENDPRVASAYEALAAAADAYDEVLYEVYDEVTPFELPGGDGVVTLGGPAEPEAVSVLIRRDYLIADPERLRRQARRLDAGGVGGAAGGAEGRSAVGRVPEPRSEGAGAESRAGAGAIGGAGDAVVAADGISPVNGGVISSNASIGVLFGEYDPDEIAARCEEFGLEEGDSTLWVCAAEVSEPGEWLAEPFEGVDQQALICRFDVSELYDDELEALDPDR